MASATRVTTFLCFVGVVLMLCSGLSKGEGRQVYVGGKHGWAPSVNYTLWATTNRFKATDTLVFKFKQGEDSVLEVTRENYEKCNRNNPIKNITEDAKFTLEKAGELYYFISGNEDHCKKGQQLVIKTLSSRSPPPASPSPSSPPPAAAQTPPPSPTPQAPAEAPAPSPSGGDAAGGDKKPSSGVFSASVPSVVVSVVVGVGVFFGNFL